MNFITIQNYYANSSHMYISLPSWLTMSHVKEQNIILGNHDYDMARLFVFVLTGLYSSPLSLRNLSACCGSYPATSVKRNLSIKNHKVIYISVMVWYISPIFQSWWIIKDNTYTYTYTYCILNIFHQGNQELLVWG